MRSATGAGSGAGAGARRGAGAGAGVGFAARGAAGVAGAEADREVRPDRADGVGVGVLDRDERAGRGPPGKTKPGGSAGPTLSREAVRGCGGFRRIVISHSALPPRERLGRDSVA